MGDERLVEELERYIKVKKELRNYPEQGVGLQLTEREATRLLECLGHAGVDRALYRRTLDECTIVATRDGTEGSGYAEVPLALWDEIRDRLRGGAASDGRTEAVDARSLETFLAAFTDCTCGVRRVAKRLIQEYRIERRAPDSLEVETP